jgi:hypothetical protein
MVANGDKSIINLGVTYCLYPSSTDIAAISVGIRIVGVGDDVDDAAVAVAVAAAADDDDDDGHGP